MHNRYAFVAGNTGAWRILTINTHRGAALATASSLDLVPAPDPISTPPGAWALHGLISNVRYATRSEVTALKAVQQPLGRPTADRAGASQDVVYEAGEARGPAALRVGRP